jgi:hypothetical protein
LEKIENLDGNFRIKILCAGFNRLTTLEGSLSIMKFIEVLHLHNNKLRNLDKNLEILKDFSFLKDLNLCGNPLSEEPEYRPRVIVAIPSLNIFDRHSKIVKFLLIFYYNISEINTIEKIKSDKIVKEYMDPLLKKNNTKKEKKLKVYEKFSVTEKELFNEAKRIEKRKFAASVQENKEVIIT